MIKCSKIHYTSHLLNVSVNGSLLPTWLLSTILSTHSWFWGTSTDPAIFLGCLAYSTKYVSVKISVSLHSIVIVAFSEISPVHSNVT